MSEPTPTLPTIGVIARRFGTDIHCVEYVIRTRRIKPAGRAGNAYIYSDVAVQEIANELQRIQHGKEAGHAAR